VSVIINGISEESVSYDWTIHLIHDSTTLHGNQYGGISSMSTTSSISIVIETERNLVKGRIPIRYSEDLSLVLSSGYL